jgi:phosphopantothenoylcysteine decarboxylase/phosphopantothenate--cysteine ligase
MKKHIVIGVTGGIACYKALDIVSKLKKQDMAITVIMTGNAAKFVAPLSFQTISQNTVITDMFETPDTWEVEHISLAKKADLFVVVPATANCIGKIAGGICDDMLTTTIMATRKPVLFVPAMNTAMYENPIFQTNVKNLKKLGYHFMEPVSGLLACGDRGTGKLPEPDAVVATILALLVVTDRKQDLTGKNILITAGPTVESIDPVRYITNHSSGKMGFALAEAAYERGAAVTLVAGPVGLSCDSGIRRIDVRTTEEMSTAVHDAFNHADALIMAAAPADYRIAVPTQEKIKKTAGVLTLTFIENEDILASIGRIKGSKKLIGFAAETSELIAHAEKKIVGKNLDFIIANDVTQEGAGFSGDTNIITIIKADGTISQYPKMTKREAAHLILDLLI